MERLQTGTNGGHEPLGTQRIHLKEAIATEMLGNELHPWLAGFTQEDEDMRCPFLSHNFDCNERLYHDVRALEAHMVAKHGVGLHVVEEHGEIDSPSLLR
jgi:hypothetical protein